MGAISIRNVTRNKTPGLPFREVAKTILPSFDISLAFVGSAQARALNTVLRKKSYVPNVLAYQVGARSGEIIICTARVQKEHARYNLSPKAFCLFLFIHGLLHLKGHHHGATMERRERELLARFVYVPSLAWRDASPQVSTSVRIKRKSLSLKKSVKKTARRSVS